MRDDFEAAIVSSNVDLTETEQEVIQSEDTSEGVNSEFDSESDNESADTNLVSQQENAQAQDQEVAAQQEQDPAKELDGDDKKSIKAPLDWGPQEREQWSKIPPALQRKIVAREKEMSDSMANTADARQTHDYIAQLGQSYAPVLAAEGAQSPLHAIKSLFDTVASLRMGTASDKAKTMGQLITHYGIDINALDSVLAGQEPQHGPHSEIEKMLDQRLAPVNQMMQSLGDMQQQKQQANQQQVQTEIQQFAQENEFLGDVRNDMADLIDMAAKQGRNLTLQEAYDRACSLNPQISSVLADRARQNELLGNQQSIASKQTAASSIHGRQGGVADAAQMSMRDQIANAWDDAQR
jgi:hypothetical protein